MILASEDIGLADPQALLVADAAARAVEFVGLPEAALNLAHAVIHLALAPKSNSVIEALGAATAAVRDRRHAARCPCTCAMRTTGAPRCSATARATSILTTTPAGWVPQEHLPAEVAGEQFYRPGRHGAEPTLTEALERRRRAQDASNDRRRPDNARDGDDDDDG